MSILRLTRATLLIALRVERLFTAKQLYLRRTTDSDITLAALLRSSCRTSHAIVSLARAGHGASALGLSRSMVEFWITIRWLTNKDTDSRAKKFTGFNSKLRERIIQLIDEYYPSVDLEQYRGNRHHDLQAMEYPKWDTWGPGIRAMATEVEVFQDDLVGVTSSKFAYDIAFFVSSYYLHPTSLGVNHHYLQPGETFNFEAQSTEEELSKQALFFTAQSLVQSALRIGLFWGTETEEAVLSVWERYGKYTGK